MRKPPEYHIQGIRHQSLTIALQLLSTSLPDDVKKKIIDRISKFEKEIPELSENPIEAALREQLIEVKYLLNIGPVGKEL